MTLPTGVRGRMLAAFLLLVAALLVVAAVAVAEARVCPGQVRVQQEPGHRRPPVVELHAVAPAAGAGFGGAGVADVDQLAAGLQPPQRQ